MSVTFRNESDLKYLIEFLNDKGLTKNGIAAVLANIYAESGFVINNLQNSGNTRLGITDEQYTAEIDAGVRPFLDKIGYGWCQWTSAGRKNGLQQLARSMGLSIAAKEVQSAYIYQELKNSYKTVLQYLVDPLKTLEECTIKFMVVYEAPANKDKESYQQKRVGYANEIYEHFFTTTEPEKVEAKMSFYPRKTRPLANDRSIILYNNAANGGQSKCINGRAPADSIANVLPNCVGYACGRFNEIFNELTGNLAMKFQKYCNHANTFISIADSYGHKRGKTPMVGSIMCWSGGTSGHGHVCVVEEVIDQNTVYVSESGWTSRVVFKYRKRTKLLGSWSTNPTYKFLGFIYNPALYNNPYPVPDDTIKKGTKGDAAKWLQTELNRYGYGLNVDGSFGAKTENALKLYQQAHGLKADGKCGAGTKVSLLKV